jgi:cytochrome c
MAAHPQITPEDAKKMVEYILSLSEEKQVTPLPLRGMAQPEKQSGGAYILMASYTDKGGQDVPPLSASQTKVLREPKLAPDNASQLIGVRVARGPRLNLENVKNNSFAVYKNIDLTGIKKGNANAYIMPGTMLGGSFELRLDKRDGEVWGTGKLQGEGVATTNFPLKEVSGFHDVYLVFINPKAGDKNLFYFGGVNLSNK